eukprot:g13919.t1
MRPFRTEGGVPVLSYFGHVDFAGFPKDTAWYFKAMFLGRYDEKAAERMEQQKEKSLSHYTPVAADGMPVLHLVAPYWWNAYRGNPPENPHWVWVYSNLAKIKLVRYVADPSEVIKKIEAIGYDENGNEVAKDVKMKPRDDTPSRQLRLSLDWPTEQRYLEHQFYYTAVVKLELVDADGVLVNTGYGLDSRDGGKNGKNFDVLVRFRLEEEVESCSLLGTGNGNPVCVEDPIAGNRVCEPDRPDTPKTAHRICRGNFSFDGPEN